ncbi:MULTISPECIES: metal ABC transporter permease [Thermoactinomyces]|jgi:zinc transport system permease protein|uniref:Metal ABC transporter permease n=1 Tax=Thermoactinomyces daqus TaxID=1329516 RepID=A0A7W1XCV2_9BACL|nr:MULTISPECIES: metal ABC transporter permease [Thermoactinomyces]MBA4544207.1 metal ABC transporter permease [Thermoactinomyces daqus]MBH8607782.1 metal ABC transporter permease [Thermoactinomyces sp. CICC 10521]
MIEMLFQFEWMRNALLAGVMIGLISPLVGVYLVVRRMSLIADALSHVTLSGVAAGLLLQKDFAWAGWLNPIYLGMVFSVIGSVFVEQLRRLYRTFQEIAIPIILSGGVGLGVVLISAANGFNVDIAGYLFGSILAVGRQELLLMAVVSGIVLLFLLIFYKELFALSFDEEHAFLTGIPRRLLNFLFIVVVALVIAASIRVVGILLVSALMTIPVAASLQFTNSFRQTCIWSVIFAQIAVLCGLFAAYYLNWASGGTIVLVSIVIFLLILLIKKSLFLFRRRKIG